jgi:RNA polymerase sigma factor CnrH
VTAGTPSPSDAELVLLALAGQQAAYRELLDRYRAAVFRLVRAHISHETDSLDVTQDTFISAFSALDDFDLTRPFRPWLFRIALNKCRDWGRRRSVRRFLAFAFPLEAADSVADAAPDAEAIVSDSQALAEVQGAIARLPQSLKSPLILHCIDGLSQAETADILGISAKAVEVKIHRARAALTDMLRGRR